MITALSVRRGPTVAAVILVAQLAGLILLFVTREALVATAVGGSIALLGGVLLFLVRKEHGVAAVVGGVSAILVGCAFLIMGSHAVVILLVAPSILGGAVALVNSDKRWALIGALLLVLTSAYLILIGGAGLVYLPALVALAFAIAAPRPASAG
jgi:hypothetical protein